MTTHPAADPLRRLTLELGDCTACEACTSLAPDCFEWDEAMGRPRLKQDMLCQSRATELMSYCPGDCILYDDAVQDGDAPATD